TIYNDDWLRSNNLSLTEYPTEPRFVDDVEKPMLGWSRFAWGRRTYEQVVGRPFMPSESSCAARG
ncbi:MAG TPA: hypothetical protein VF762_04445, partial [Blastocatellia bacterium]